LPPNQPIKQPTKQQKPTLQLGLVVCILAINYRPVCRPAYIAMSTSAEYRVPAMEYYQFVCHSSAHTDRYRYGRLTHSLTRQGSTLLLLYLVGAGAQQVPGGRWLAFSQAKTEPAVRNWGSEVASQRADKLLVAGCWLFELHHHRHVHNSISGPATTYLSPYAQRRPAVTKNNSICHC